MHEDAIARRVVRPWPWLVSVVRQRVVEVISVFDWVANAVVWCLKAGHSRRVHIKDREHGRGLPEFVRQPTRTRMISQRRSRVRFGLLLIMVDPRPDCAGTRPGCASRWPLKRHQGMRRGHARCWPWSPGIAFRMDCELLGRYFRDPTHRTAEEVGQIPRLALNDWCHDDIQAFLPFQRYG